MMVTQQKKTNFRLAAAEVDAATASQRSGTPVQSLNLCKPSKCPDKRVPDKLEGKQVWKRFGPSNRTHERAAAGTH